MTRLIQLLTLMQKSSWFVRATAPWVLRMFRASFLLIFISVLAIWEGVPRKLDELADDWVDQARFAGVPTNITPALRVILWWLGLLAVILGWIVLSYLTVFILGRL